MNLSENLIWKYLIAAVHKTRHNFFSSCKEWQQSSLSDGKKKDSHSKTISFFFYIFPNFTPNQDIFFSLSSKMLSYNFARLTLNLKGLFKLKILTTIWQKLTYLLRLKNYLINFISMLVFVWVNEKKMFVQITVQVF